VIKLKESLMTLGSIAGVPNLGSADPFGSAAWLLWIRGRIPKKINILALIEKILIIF
jgi:hypothetical protein